MARKTLSDLVRDRDAAATTERYLSKIAQVLESDHELATAVNEAVYKMGGDTIKTTPVNEVREAAVMLGQYRALLSAVMDKTFITWPPEVEM